jgi:hypothetical protein
MSKKAPIQVQQLCRRLRPFLQKESARRELKALCKIRHRSQFNRWFPRQGLPLGDVRLTARVALTSLRWREEHAKGPSWRFVPSWPLVWMMGKSLIKARNTDFVAILANHVGGGISRDQIYSYFPMRRREPDGEFVLRFLNLIARLRGMERDNELGRSLRAHLDWDAINSVLQMEQHQGKKRVQRLRHTMVLHVKRPRIQRYQTPSTILKRMAGKPRPV